MRRTNNEQERKAHAGDHDRGVRKHRMGPCGERLRTASEMRRRVRQVPPQRHLRLLRGGPHRPGPCLRKEPVPEDGRRGKAFPEQAGREDRQYRSSEAGPRPVGEGRKREARRLDPDRASVDVWWPIQGWRYSAYQRNEKSRLLCNYPRVRGQVYRR